MAVLFASPLTGYHLRTPFGRWSYYCWNGKNSTFWPDIYRNRREAAVVS